MRKLHGGLCSLVAGLSSLLPPIGAILLAGCGEMRLAEGTREKQPARSEAKSLTVELGGGVAILLVYIPPGSFTMGSTEEELKALLQKWPQVKEYWVSNEMPAHRVTIRKGFYMGKYEVTQELWEAVMGSNPSESKGPKKPVQASWLECQEFIKRLNEKTGRRFALPSETEWEYACRAGSTTRFSFGDDEKSMTRFACPRSFYGRVNPVGQKEPNGWGLYDMYGNISEWCEDIGHDNYVGAPSDGSPWLTGGDKDYRMHRGGCWDDNPYFFRSAARLMALPKTNTGTRGLRIVLRDLQTPIRP